MVNTDELIAQDLKHIWHPCTQMKDFEDHPPTLIKRAEGSYLYTNEGPVIDAISSWWCKSLGHGHPAILSAMKEQLSRFEHVMGATLTFPSIIELGEQLAELSGLQHVFFASDGSSAVEIAMKLALHASQLQGYNSRKQFIALKNGYHGETIATMSVSDLGIYKKPYTGLGVNTHFLKDIPYVTNTEDPLWQDCSLAWSKIEKELEIAKEVTCAILVEPIIQGAGGMLCYSADFLTRLSTWAKKNHIYIIADEIMTGLGRTGKWLACDHAGITPDMICLSKGLTSGAMPLSCVLIDNPIYQLFYHDAAEGKSFMHSHTYSGNPLAVSAALATIKTMRTEGIIEQAQALSQTMRSHFNDIASKTGKLRNIRSIGAVVAGDLEERPSARVGYKLRQEALKRGALLRPIGNTLYWLPPLNMNMNTLEQLSEITLNSIEAVYS